MNDPHLHSTSFHFHYTYYFPFLYAPALCNTCTFNDPWCGLGSHHPSNVISRMDADYGFGQRFLTFPSLLRIVPRMKKKAERESGLFPLQHLESFWWIFLIGVCINSSFLLVFPERTENIGFRKIEFEVIACLPLPLFSPFPFTFILPCLVELINLSGCFNHMTLLLGQINSGPKIDFLLQNQNSSNVN